MVNFSTTILVAAAVAGPLLVNAAPIVASTSDIETRDVAVEQTDFVSRDLDAFADLYERDFSDDSELMSRDEYLAELITRCLRGVSPMRTTGGRLFVREEISDLEARIFRRLARKVKSIFKKSPTPSMPSGGGEEQFVQRDFHDELDALVSRDLHDQLDELVARGEVSDLEARIFRRLARKVKSIFKKAPTPSMPSGGGEEQVVRAWDELD